VRLRQLGNRRFRRPEQLCANKRLEVGQQAGKAEKDKAYAMGSASHKKENKILRLWLVAVRRGEGESLGTSGSKCSGGGRICEHVRPHVDRGFGGPAH